MKPLDLYAQLQDCMRAHTPHVLVTLIAVRGGAPQDIGAKMIVTSQGLLCGTVGGGQMEATCIHYAEQMIADRRAHALCTWNLQTDIGMTCGGEVTLFFEGGFLSPWSIAVFGAGHVAQALVPLLAQLDAQITCIDDRQAWLDRLPNANNVALICESSPTTAVSMVPREAFVVVMTQGHHYDLPILEALYNSGQPFPYVGMIGSSVKAIRTRKQLLDLGVSKQWAAALHSPIGLPIGGNHPVEIAVSITAQLLQVRDQILAAQR